jgi:glucose-6-phosphate isomerase
VLLSLYHDKPASEAVAREFLKENILEKLKAVDSRARRKGLESLDPRRNPLIALGTEIDAQGKVTKNSYGVFNLSWQAEHHPEWPGTVMRELNEIRERIKSTHGTGLRFLIWAGMGGSAEDKAMYNAVGLLKKGPRLYILDSTDPAKLKSILEDMTKRSGLSLAEALKSTLVVGMAMGMTSYEPVVNLEKLAALYSRNRVDSKPNFIYLTFPDSLLDQFGKKQGYRRIQLQLDDANGTAGRHSAPLTRGSLYPLGLAGVDLTQWIRATALSAEEIGTAWRLSSFLHTQARAGRNKIDLLLPKEWSGAALWTKQDFEESLGKSEDFGLKIVIGENPKLANFRAPKDAGQDRCFLAVQVKGLENTEAQKATTIRRAGYPTAVLTLNAPELSRYMQFMHYVVFGIAYLEKMNFVTQPGVELYKAITNKLHAEGLKLGGIEKTAEWQRIHSSPHKVKWQNSVTLYFDRLPEGLTPCGSDAPSLYASIIKQLACAKKIEYGELTFFGDSRYSTDGKNMRKTLDRAAERVFRGALKMSADVYEGPAMNHSYHEMIIGHGRCLSTVLLSDKGEKIPTAAYTADYHRAQFLATQMALAERGRAVVAITVKDLEEGSLAALDSFFRQVALTLKSRRGRC